MGAAGGRKCGEAMLHLMSAHHLQESHLELSRKSRGEKVPPFFLHKKTGQNAPLFTVLSLFVGSDTCHIWDSASGPDEQGAGWSVTSRHRRAAPRRPSTNKSQHEPRRSARLMTHHDKRQRYHSNTLIHREPHNFRF